MHKDIYAPNNTNPYTITGKGHRLGLVRSQGAVTNTHQLANATTPQSESKGIGDSAALAKSALIEVNLCLAILRRGHIWGHDKNEKMQDHGSTRRAGSYSVVLTPPATYFKHSRLGRKIQ